MKIKLDQLDESGQEYNCTRKTGEFNESLADLIKTHDYQIDFQIRPINSKDFQFMGTLSTSLREDCSKCGIAFNYPVKAKYHEILVPPQPAMERQAKYARVNHVSETNTDGPGSTEYGTDNTFDAGEFIHELIGLNVPLNPLPEATESGACSICGDDKFCQAFRYDEALEDFKPKSPFEGLKNLKL